MGHCGTFDRAWGRGIIAFGVVLVLVPWVHAVSGSDGLPPEVAAQFAAAMEVEGSDTTFVGTYTMIEEAEVATPRGEIDDTIRAISRVTRHADGRVTTHLVKYIQNGRDRTEKRRKEYEEVVTDESEHEEPVADLVEPLGENARYYRFATVRVTNGVARVDYEPRPDAGDLDGLARGSISWDAETLDPVSITFTYIKLPKKFKEYSGEVRFARHRDAVYVTAMEVRALVKISIFRRRVTLKQFFEEIEPASGN